MTVAVPDGVQEENATSIDRRMSARTPRRSWAHPQPYIERSARTSVDESQLWRRMGNRYAWSTSLVDFFAVTAVGAGLLLTVRPFFAYFTPLGGLLFVLLVALQRGYSPQRMGSDFSEFQVAGKAAMYLALGLVIAEFAFYQDIPRRLVVMGLPLVLIITWVDRHRRRRALHRARWRGRGMRRTVVVGTQTDAMSITKMLASATHYGYEPIGICVPDLDLVEEGPLPVLGAVSDAVQVAVDHSADVVLVTASGPHGEGLRRLSWALGRIGAELVVAPDIVEVSAPRLSVRPAAGLALLEVEVGPAKAQRVTKSVFDAVIGSLLLLGVSPIIAAAAIAVRVTSAGPVFFRQIRVGVDGATFTMWKLRTMVRDAEKLREALVLDSASDRVLFKMENDPRITPVGKFLRRYSIDELPQLWNVVRGDMSLVGPRPPLKEEVVAFGDTGLRRLRVKPGMTGLWQVSGRSDLSDDEAVRLDLRYVDNWSIAFDLAILWKTWRAVIRGSGAY